MHFNCRSNVLVSEPLQINSHFFFLCVTLFRSRYSSTASQLWRVQNKNKSTVFDNGTTNNKGSFKRTKVWEGRRSWGEDTKSLYQHRWYIYSSHPSAAQLPPHNTTWRRLAYTRSKCSPRSRLLRKCTLSSSSSRPFASGTSVAPFAEVRSGGLSADLRRGNWVTAGHGQPQLFSI